MVFFDRFDRRKQTTIDVMIVCQLNVCLLVGLAGLVKYYFAT